MVRKTTPEKRLLTAAKELQAFCESHGWRACLIGGLAAIRWGRPRTTRDVDLSLWTGLGEESPFVDALLTEFQPRIQVTDTRVRVPVHSLRYTEAEKHVAERIRRLTEEGQCIPQIAAWLNSEGLDPCRGGSFTKQIVIKFKNGSTSFRHARKSGAAMCPASIRPRN